jgi:hypothetical protein
VSQLILLVVAAAWAAVLLPPLLRSRMEGRGSSITSFRRQLTSLQRSAPGMGMPPMRQMARPLAGPQQYARGPQQAQYPRGYAQSRPVSTLYGYDQQAYAADRRPMRMHAGVQQPYSAPVASRSAAKQRRQNILFMLGIATAASGLLMAVTTGPTMKYAFAFSACMLVGYVYLLSQTRRQELERTAYENWRRAA